jgi:hypothetical protein
MRMPDAEFLRNGSQPELGSKWSKSLDVVV